MTYALPVTLEEQIAKALDLGDLRTAATLTLRGYGPEVLGLLHAVLRDQALVDDAYAEFSERLWSSLPRWERRCGMRTWASLLARRAAIDARRAEKRRRVEQPLGDEISRVAQAVRTATLPHLRTANKDAIAALRDELPEDDRTLLVLRVDRALAWNELAIVFLSSEADDEAVRREAARLRKRFQLVKERLYAMGRERGLLSDGSVK